MTPREARLAGVQNLIREADRTLRRMAVQHEHVGELHKVWNVLAGDTPNQDAIDAKIELADVEDLLDKAMTQLELAVGRMEAFESVL